MTIDPELPGPYELMWLSDAECPVFEDVGLGIGCLKVKGCYSVHAAREESGWSVTVEDTSYGSQ